MDFDHTAGRVLKFIGLILWKRIGKNGMRKPASDVVEIRFRPAKQIESVILKISMDLLNRDLPICFRFKTILAHVAGTRY